MKKNIFNMYSKDGKRVAFTLAEVLITLTIIGVIAAFTIPNLISKYQNYQMATKFVKVYRNLNSSISIALRDVKYNTLEDWSGAINEGQDSFPVLVAQNLKIKKNCGFMWSGKTDGSWGSQCSLHTVINTGKPLPAYESIISTRKLLNGNKGVSPVGSPYDKRYAFVLEDGALVVIQPKSYSSVNWYPWTLPYKSLFWIDVNGEDVLPNQMGRDIYMAGISLDDKFVPYGLNLSDDCIKGGNGFTCAKKIIIDKNVNY